jgi:hypothetical protein
MSEPRADLIDRAATPKRRTPNVVQLVVAAFLGIFAVVDLAHYYSTGASRDAIFAIANGLMAVVMVWDSLRSRRAA